MTVFPSWFVVPYLIVAIVQLFAINSMDLYSSGVTLQSIGLHLKRYHCVLIDTLVAGGFTFYAIFSSRFSQLLADFLLVHHRLGRPMVRHLPGRLLLRGGRYDAAALQDEKGGLYYRRGGIHWPAIIAQALGMVAAALWLNAVLPVRFPALESHRGLGLQRASSAFLSAASPTCCSPEGPSGRRREPPRRRSR